MPVSPNFLERLVLLRLNRGPAPILDLFGAGVLESVSLARDLGLFEALADEGTPLSAAALADRIDADPGGTEILCEFLAAAGYLDAAGDGYRLTGMTERWLLPGGETDLGPWLAFWTELVFPFWDRELETAVREGAPSQSIYDWFDEEPERWAIAQDGFRATASLLVDDVVDAVSVPDGSGRLLDIGGGHGLYSFELCRAHPELAATIYDLQGAIDAIDGEIPADVADQITTRVGDYRTDDLGSGYDLALVFNVVHAHEPAEIAALFERVGDALAPGGRILVLDQWEGTGRTPVSRAGLRFVALTYLATLGATVYDPDDVGDWLRDAGFGDVTRHSVGPVAGQAIIEATVR